LPVKPDPQAQGSAITYARRYSLSAIIGLCTEEDDDAEGAMNREQDKDTPEIKGHWCSVHKTPFFKRGKMKGYAHPIKDENGETGEWCSEDKAGSQPTAPGTEVARPKAGTELSTEPQTSGAKVQNITEFKGLLAKHKVGTREAYEILSIGSFMELVDLDDAWSQIKKAKGIEP